MQRLLRYSLPGVAILVAAWLAWPRDDQPPADAPDAAATTTPGHPAHPAPAIEPDRSHAGGTAAAADPVREPVGATPPAAPPAAELITGVVVDANDTPVADAVVFLMPWLGAEASRHGCAWAHTDAAGRFAVTATFDGELLVVATAVQRVKLSGVDAPALRLDPAFAVGATRTTARARASLDVGTIRLPSGAAITGRVREGGVPLADVPILWAPDSLWDVAVGAFSVHGLAGGAFHVEPTGPGQREHTDADGRFRIATAPNAIGWLAMLTPEYHIERLVTMPQVSAPATVVFELAVPACVRVLVDGRPEPLRVAVEGLDLPLRTDAAGEVRVRRSVAAPLRASITLAGEPRHDFAIPAGSCAEQPTIVELTRAATTPLEVTLACARPLRAVRAALLRTDVTTTAIALQPATNAANGMTLAARVPRGNYRLTIDRGADGDDRFVLPWEQAVVVGGEPVHLTASLALGGHVECTVRDRHGEMVAGRCKLVAADGRELVPMFGYEGKGRLWPDRPSHSRTPLPPGRYEALVDVRDRGTHRCFVDVQVGATARIEIRLP
jgi:hypothetical protein